MTIKILRLPTVIEKTGKPRSTIYWMIENNLFPKQIKLSVRSVGWLESEVNAWIEQRVNESRLCGDTK
jgi:prophage regulatory protein